MQLLNSNPHPPAAKTQAPNIFNMGGAPTSTVRIQPNLGNGADALIKTPISGIFPGAVAAAPTIENPAANDPKAAERGLQYFTTMNCVGCHAPNGGGGMGLALSNRFFQYGSTPANIYLSIVQGRPNGMPAWGSALPPSAVWDLVAYITEISKAPAEEWGTTISVKSPAIEQVPAEYGTPLDPWSRTEPFSQGQKPEGRDERK